MIVFLKTEMEYTRFFTGLKSPGFFSPLANGLFYNLYCKSSVYNSVYCKHTKVCEKQVLSLFKMLMIIFYSNFLFYFLFPDCVCVWQKKSDMKRKLLFKLTNWFILCLYVCTHLIMCVLDRKCDFTERWLLLNWSET